MRIRENFRLNEQVVNLLKLITEETCAPSNTRVVESAIVAFGAQILGCKNEAVKVARWELMKEVNRNRSK